MSRTQATEPLEKEPIHARVDGTDDMRFVSFDAEYAEIDALEYWKDEHPVDYIELVLRNESWAGDVYRHILEHDDVDSIQVGTITHDGESIRSVRFSNPFHGDRLEHAVNAGGN